MPKSSDFFARPVRLLIPTELASEASLLAFLDLSAKELKKIWWYRGQMYCRFEIAKGNGHSRVIDAPDKRLKYLQRQIATLLNKIYRVRNPVHGFVVDKSVKTNAFAHLRKKFILNIDIKEFFPSITEKRVCGLLQALGIDGSVARILARVCCNDGHLPQGAPTSPVLSNMICFRLDRELLTLAKNARCIYTRYADDITFSSYQPMAALFEATVPPAGHFVPDLLTLDLQDAFTNNGFVINPQKAHYADRHSRRTVTGIKINELLNVDRRYVRNIRAALHSVEKLGPKDAQARFESQFGGKSNLEAHLEGKISWLRHIKGQSDPLFRRIAIRFNDCYGSRKIDVIPTATEIQQRAIWGIEGVKDETRQASAFFLKDVGLVTAAHCVNGETKMMLFHYTRPDDKREVTVHKIDDHRDLAILKHNLPNTEYFELEQSKVVAAARDELLAAGYPDYVKGDGLNLWPGTATSFPMRNGVRMIEVTQQLTGGMSGGPIVDSRNEVTGVIKWGGKDVSRNFAVHIDALNDWIAE